MIKRSVRRLLDYLRMKIYYPHIMDSYVQSPKLVHKNARVQFSNISGKVQVGSNSVINKVDMYGEVEIGSNTTINGPNSEIHTLLHAVNIGNFCSIASNTSIRDHNHNLKSCTSYFIKHHVLGGNYGDDVVSKGPVVIKNDVWIGTQTVILSGVTIGNGAVIGANTVVDKDIPPYAIAVGSPAKVIKYRFDEEIIEKLLEIQWWKWSIDRIRRNHGLFEGDLTVDKINNIVD